MTEQKIEGFELVERRVKPMGTGAGVHLPRAWLGKAVKVVRVED